MTESIYLIGLMGSGKSTVGRLLASLLGVDYLDNDATIAVSAGVQTVELARSGTTALHDWERRYVADLAGREGRHVAGIPASAADRPDDLAALRSLGLLVYLRCPPQVLAARIAAGPPRPWVDGDPTALVTAMYAARDPRLTQACGLTVDGRRSAHALAADIAAAADITP